MKSNAPIHKHNIHIEPYNVDIPVDDNTLLKDAIKNFGIDFPCGGNGLCGNCNIELISGDIELDSLQLKLLEKKGLSDERWRIACRCRVHGDISIRIPDMAHSSILSDNTLPDRSGENGYAAAVDLGSTTIVVQIIDKRNGKILATQSGINDQHKFGADIISRIAYAIQNQEHSDKLGTCVRDQIGNMIKITSELCQVTDKIENVIIVGNSVMHALFCGIDVTPLSAFPFQSSNNNTIRFTAEDLGWKINRECTVTFMQNIGHFVGSDILAGILRLKIHEQDKWITLIDLGTNGEIVIGNKSKILYTSTAAGPAFEGINIINGMRAVNGAICKINAETGESEVIGNTAPTGICGSGLIDAIYYFLRQGLITQDGQIADGSLERLPIQDNVYLYNKDIREFQLAKAAIATGLELLAEELGISMDEIGSVYIAGGLGNYLDITHACGTGLIKGIAPSKIVKAGNLALAGCKEMIFKSAEEEIGAIVPLLTHYSLETDPLFLDKFCENLYF